MPIYPPPTTTMVSGTVSRASAPVELTIFFSSMSTLGSAAMSEPVAIRMFSAFKTWVSPDSTGDTVTSSLPVMAPDPTT